MQTAPPTIEAVIAPFESKPGHPEQIATEEAAFNSVIYANYSNPDITRVRKDFYLTASSFDGAWDLPILHSKDLINWKVVNQALKHGASRSYPDASPACRAGAPSIRFHAGKFWVFFSRPDEGIYVTTAEDPYGKWSEPILLRTGKGLTDPCPLWDDQGKAYLVHGYARFASANNRKLCMCPMAADASSLLSDGMVAFCEPKPHSVLERPKLFTRDGYYYLVVSCGDAQAGWLTALRSKSIYGPYERKTIVQSGDPDINTLRQGVLIEASKRDWWFVHFQPANVNGRIVQLEPVQWENGWPSIGKCAAQLVRSPKPLSQKDKNSLELETSPKPRDEEPDTRWQIDQPDTRCSTSARAGWIRLAPRMLHSNNALTPDLRLRKPVGSGFFVGITLDFFPMQWGEEAGLMVMGESQATIGMLYDGRYCKVVLRLDDKLEVLSETASNIIKFRIQLLRSGQCSFSFQDRGAFISTREKIRPKKGSHIELGLYSFKRVATASAGHADFGSFKFL